MKNVEEYNWGRMKPEEAVAMAIAVGISQELTIVERMVDQIEEYERRKESAETPENVTHLDIARWHLLGMATALGGKLAQAYIRQETELDARTRAEDAERSRMSLLSSAITDMVAMAASYLATSTTNPRANPEEGIEA